MDNNGAISNIEKMNYLKSFLKGDAERAINGFSLSNDNYVAAVQLLKERFGQKQTLINAYMEALWKIPNANGEVKKLRTFYDTMESYIRGLEALDVPSESYGCLLLPMLLRKIPEEVRRELIRASGDLDVDVMRNLLRKEIETLEKSMIGTENNNIYGTQSCAKTVNKYVSPVSSVNAMFAPTTSDNRSKNCLLCYPA